MDELHYHVNLLKEMNEKISHSEKMYRQMTDTSSNAFIYYSYEKETFWNLGNWDSFFEFEIKSKQDLQRLVDLVEPSNREAMLEMFAFDKRDEAEAEKKIVCHIAEKGRWYSFEGNLIKKENGECEAKVIRICDITREKETNDQLQELAFYDSLTGLYARNYFVKCLGEFVRKASEENNIVSLMILDVDEFKKINDGLGIMYGDEFVQILGYFLKKYQSENCIVSHFCEDVFCVAVYEPGRKCNVEQIYKDVCEWLREPVRLSNGMEVMISVSAGVAEYPETSQNALDLINNAEIVLFKVKESGKDSIGHFDQSVYEEFQKQIRLDQQIKEALTRDGFEMYYQPQFFLDTGRLRGMEALIRMRDAEGNLVPPSDFIPVAEKNGTMYAIGEWIVNDTLKTFAEWKKKYGYPIILSINISTLQFKRHDFVGKLIKKMKEYDISPSEVEIEITESVLMEDSAKIVERLESIRELGCKISLDDFGTGFSSLSYLKNLPMHTVKIDKSFMDTVLGDNATQVITEAIVYMAKKLSLECVAEGIESKEQLEYMKGIGCDVMQGFYRSKPLPAEGIELIIQENL